MLALLLLAPGHASAVSYADVRLVNAQCQAFGDGDAEAWPAGRALRLTGEVRVSSSAPGGPVSHATTPLSAAGLQLTRVGCQVPEPGVFTVVGRCGEDLMIRYSGALLPGEVYRFSGEGGWPQITVAGASTGEGCPPPPTPVAYVDERTPLSQSTEAMTLPEGAVYVDATLKHLELQASTLSTLLGLPNMWGLSTMAYGGEPSLSDPATAQVTRSRFRHVYDEEDEGGVWCTTREEEEVAVALDGADVVFTFIWQGEPERRRGRCPQP